MIFRILEDQFAQKIRDSRAADQRYMQLALALGRRGQGRTWPNPAVGAVVVKDGVIVGRGWTQPGGRPHAEPEALLVAQAQEKGELFDGPIPFVAEHHLIQIQGHAPIVPGLPEHPSDVLFHGQVDDLDRQ